MKKLIVIFLSVFMLTGCLSKSSYNIDYPNEYPLKSVSDLDKMVRGIYTNIYSNAWSCNISNDAFMNHTADDVRGVDNPAALQGDGPYFWLWKGWETSRLSDHFSFAYRNIASCNEVIDFIDAAYVVNDIPFKGQTTADNDKIRKNCDRIKGEMHFLRALEYHFLLRAFCPPYISKGHSNNETRLLPYKIHLDKTVSGNKNPKIASVQEIFDQVVEDLKLAKEFLPKQYDAAVHDVSYKEGHPTYWAASALLARIYFQRREWSLCEAECTNVINNGGFTLVGTQPLDAWIKNCGNATSKEVIFEFATSREQGGRPSRWTSQAKNWYNPKNGGRFTGLDGTNNGGKGYFNKSQWTHVVWSYSALEYVGWWQINQSWNSQLGTQIVNSYSVLPEAMKDKRYTQLNYRMEADPTPAQLAGLSAAEIQKQFPDSLYAKAWNFPNPYLYSDKYYRAPDGEFSKTPYIRLPELLLSRAIIKQKFNIGSSSALNDVNAVRVRAGLDPLSAVTAEDIHKERLKEMSMEVGDRRFYLQALDLPVPIGDRDPSLYSPILSPYFAAHIPLPINEVINNNSYDGMELPNQ